MPTDDLNDSDAPVITAVLAAAESQKPVLTSLGGVPAWVARWAWTWLRGVIGGYIVSFVIDGVVITLLGWGAIKALKWLVARFDKASATMKLVMAPKVTLARGGPPLWFDASESLVSADGGTSDPRFRTLKQSLAGSEGQSWVHCEGPDAEKLADDIAFYLNFPGAH